MNQAKEKAIEYLTGVGTSSFTIKKAIDIALQEQAKEMIEVIERNLCIERMGSYDNIEGQMDWKGFKEKYGGKGK